MPGKYGSCGGRPWTICNKSSRILLLRPGFATMVSYVGKEDRRGIMDQTAGFRTVRTPASVELVINKSRFIGQCFPVASEEEALEKLSALRKQFWDATHNCYAYSVGQKGEIARFSDDGEPGGTAGMPMMDALRGAGVTNVLCVVTRYFGGILLGTGGLVRAYSRACAEAVRAAGVVRMAPCDLVRFSVPYAQWAMLQQEARRQGALLTPEYGERISCIAAIEADRTAAFLDAVFDQSAGSLKGIVSGRELRSVEDYDTR